MKSFCFLSNLGSDILSGFLNLWFFSLGKYQFLVWLCVFVLFSTFLQKPKSKPKSRIGPPVYPKPNSVERIPFFNHLSIKPFKTDELHLSNKPIKNEERFMSNKPLKSDEFHFSSNPIRTKDVSSGQFNPHERFGSFEPYRNNERHLSNKTEEHFMSFEPFKAQERFLSKTPIKNEEHFLSNKPFIPDALNRSKKLFKSEERFMSFEPFKNEERCRGGMSIKVGEKREFKVWDLDSDSVEAWFAEMKKKFS